MILTCPNCSARFMIEGHALGPVGRTVRCGACGHAWLQLPEPSAAEPEIGLEPSPALAPSGAAAAARAAEAVAQEANETGGKRARRRRHAETAEREGVEATPRRARLARVLVGFLFVFVVAAIAIGGYRYRQDIVSLWPPATRLYQVLGLKVDPPSGYWLRVPQDSIRFRRESEGGNPILVVSGEILNPSDQPQRLVPMRILLLDKENRVLRTERVKIDNRTVDPGKRVPFQTSIPNPPSEAAAVRITFDVTG